MNVSVPRYINISILHTQHTTYYIEITFILMCIKCTLFAWLGLCMLQEDDDDDESVRMCIKTGFLQKELNVVIYESIHTTQHNIHITDAHLSVDYFNIIVWMHHIFITHVWYVIYVSFIEKWCVLHSFINDTTTYIILYILL